MYVCDGYGQVPIAIFLWNFDGFYQKLILNLLKFAVSFTHQAL